MVDASQLHIGTEYKQFNKVATQVDPLGLLQVLEQILFCGSKPARWNATFFVTFRHLLPLINRVSLPPRASRNRLACVA
jgi:hypothetical protein